MVSFSVFIGTRPEIIKMAPFLLYLQEKKADFELVFTGQHYDYNMSRIFFEEFGIREPDCLLNTGGQEQYAQIGDTLKKAAEHLQKTKPNLCVVNGDTNTTLASSLASARSGIPLSHIEAGCRAFDLTVPEEVNRLVCDRLCTLLFPPTKYCQENLLAEGIDNSKIFMHGNTNADVFALAKPKAQKRKKHSEFGVEKGKYVLATFHRPSSVDEREPLKNIILALKSLPQKVILPLHPRTRKNLASFGLLEELKGSNIIACEPMSYFDFLSLTLDCDFLISDSGGGMEDAALAGKRCIVPRENVEWYELVYNKIVFLCHPKKEEILSAVKRLKSQPGAVPAVYTEPEPSINIAKTIMQKSSEKPLLARDFSREGRLGLFFGERLLAPGTARWKKIDCW